MAALETNDPRRATLRRPMSIWIAGPVEACVEAARTGLIDAVVTNPTVVAEWCAGGATVGGLARDVTERTRLPLFLQTRASEASAIVDEAFALSALAPRVVPKLPSTLAGLEATRLLVDRGVRPLITTVCTLRQALAFAAAGAGYLCPYYARLLEAGGDPDALIRDASTRIQRSGVDCPILPASIRTTDQIDDVLAAGASGVIVFERTFREFCRHPVTDASLEAFERDDWPKIRP